jgi:Tol biopolymer transport system component
VVHLGAGGRRLNFFRVDLATGEGRQLTDLTHSASIQSFDISPDGASIVFDRRSDNADIVVMDLAEP